MGHSWSLLSCDISVLSVLRLGRTFLVSVVSLFSPFSFTFLASFHRCTNHVFFKHDDSLLDLFLIPSSGKATKCGNSHFTCV